MIITEDAIVVEDSAFPLSAENPLSKIDMLITRYKTDKEKIIGMHEYLGGRGNAQYLHYLYDTRSLFVSNSILPLEKSLKMLDAEYWNLALRLTDIYELMPHNRKEEWQKNIDELQVWPFERDAVIETLSSLLNERPMFFAESVDHIFKRLSRDHITNVPEGFTKRMILNYVLQVYSSFYSVRSDSAEILNDLRNCIAKLIGLSMTTHNNSYGILKNITDTNMFGQWVTVDNGNLKIKLFKKGTLHIEVDPEIAARLNTVLATIYPAAIPSKFRSKNQAPVKQEIKVEKTIHYSVIDLLLNSKPCKYNQDWIVYFQDSRLKDQAMVYKDEVDEIMKFLDAKPHNGQYSFSYDPTLAIQLLCLMGSYPCYKSYQYYPTPKKLVDMARDMASIDDGMTILEPSAGHGNLLEGLGEHNPIQCYELSKVNVSILKAKKFQVQEADFLAVPPRTQYDRILMNPPYTKNQAEKHVNHALQFLKPGGILVCILPSTFLNHKFVENAKHDYSPIYENEFENTAIRTVIVSIELNN